MVIKSIIGKMFTILPGIFARLAGFPAEVRVAGKISFRDEERNIARIESSGRSAATKPRRVLSAWVVIENEESQQVGEVGRALEMK